MSIFSQTLTRLMTDRGLTAYKLEKRGALQRTTITKYANGKSKPPNKESLEELIRMMALGTDEAEELREAYAIAKIGEAIYFRRKHVEEFLKTINNTNIVYPFDVKRYNTLHLNHDVECVKGRLSVTNILGVILSMEADEEEPQLRIIAQPDGNIELMSYLKTMTIMEEKLKIDHIICIDNKSTDDDNAYNINVLKEIMALIVSGGSYTPYYYYDDVKSHINQFSSFPNVIITSKYAMIISYHFDKAIISDFRDFINLQETFFDDLRRSCDTYVQALPSPLDILSYYEKTVNGIDNIIPDFSVMPDPCLVPFLDEDIIRKHARFEIPNVDNAVDLLIKRIFRYRNDMDKKTEISYCTERGFKRFMETGIITEIPEEYYIPFGVDIRRLMVRRMYDAIKRGKYRLKILNDRFNIQNISFACYNEYSMTYCYNHPAKGMLSFGFRERSTINSIYDYFTTLEEQNMLLSDDETEKFILEMINKK